MNYFRCTVGGSGKGKTVIVTCDEEFAGLTITLAKTGKTYTKTCPSTAPYTVTYYGVENGTYTVSCTLDGQTYSETVVVQDISCALNYGFNWQTWVDTASQLDLSDYDTLDEVLADEKALRELFLEHACVDYMAELSSSNEDLETVINDDYCAKWINNSDYALDFLGANTVIKALMDTADKYGYGEWVITDDTTTPPTWGAKGNVPVMTSDRAPYGSVIGSGATSGKERYKAFNGQTPDTASNVYETQTAPSSTYIGYKFVNPVCVRKVSYVSPFGYQSGAFGMKIFVVKGSNDGSNWETLTDTINVVSQSTEEPTIANIDNDNYYLYYALFALDNWGTAKNYTQAGEIQFYGRELKVSVPTMTSNTAPFGEVVYSGNKTGYNPFTAFDGDDSTSWRIENTNLNEWIGYKFDTDVKITRCKVLSSWIGSFKIQADDNDDNWTDVSEVITASSTNDFAITADRAYKRYRLIILSKSSGTEYVIFTLQFYGLDYSEKEFEVGSTKKWLYDHGVELETLEMRIGNQSGNGYIKEDNQIYFKTGTVNSNTGTFAMVMAHVDLAPYSLERLKIGDKQYVSIGVTCLDIGSSDALFPNGGTQNTSYRVAAMNLVDGSSILPNNIALDISSINDDYLFFGVQYVASRYATLAEWWLE